MDWSERLGMAYLLGELNVGLDHHIEDSMACHQKFRLALKAPEMAENYAAILIFHMSKGR